ncbi:MAG TPA: hypothetical protein VF463_08645 [Sphingobium sp.]
MDMSVHRRPRAQGEGDGRLRGATIAGLVTLACLIAVPVELLELGLASIGLSEILPVLAPPIGWPVRIALALCGAAIAAVVGSGVLGRELGGADAVMGIVDAGSGMKGNGIMGWTRSLGLHHLARLARGDDGGFDSYAPAAPGMRAPAFRKPEAVPSLDLLRRSRKDMHPDAPPRAPLVASRDLPVVTEFSVIEAGPDIAPPPPPIACASPIRDTTSEVRPRPLPRSPAPLSDSDLSWVRGLLSNQDGNKEKGSAHPSVSPAVEPEIGRSKPASPILDGAIPVDAVPLTATEPETCASLLSLVDRFEQGVAHRIALRDATHAMGRVEESLTGQPAPAPAAAMVEDGLDDADVPLEMDDALNAALETLRKLSVKANGR